MGLLKVGKPLKWEESVQHSEYIRKHGVLQFLSTYERRKGIENDRLFYGDEIEYGLLKIDTSSRTVRISLRGGEVMEELNRKESSTDKRGGYGGCTWHQEYGSWMVEGTPQMPFGGYTSSLLQVEKSMRLRRARLISVLGQDEIAPTMVNFPLLGVGDFVHPPAKPGGPSSESATVPDACINPHPRFGTLTANIRSRRGSKVDIQVPIFKDIATSADETMIKMDCMAYGMGCCCLQVTFQCSDVDESRYLHDQLAPLAPIMMALTAATPILHGKLAGTDVRWQVIASSVDDRTPAERGERGASAEPNPQMAGGGVRHMSKSRYDSISAYISQEANFNPEVTKYFNDVPCEVDGELQEQLLKSGIDAPLAHHVAHLFVRDPLVVFEGVVSEVDDKTATDHFESLNSTNWQTLRFKPPPPKTEGGAHIGWRTEFRPMEAQLTDFENAAFTAFIVLLTRVLLVFNLDFLVPISKVDDNMKRAHGIDAVNTSKFWFRSHVIPAEANQFKPRPAATKTDGYEEMTMTEIINGKGDSFAGLVPLCYAYLEHIQCDENSFAGIDKYLRFIQQRATGKLPTPATWMRKFVRAHPEYKKDSVITQGIAYDLVRACDEIGLGIKVCPDLLGDVVVKPIASERPWDKALVGGNTGKERSKLLQELAKRSCPEDGALSLPSAPHRKRARSSSFAGADNQ